MSSAHPGHAGSSKPEPYGAVQAVLEELVSQLPSVQAVTLSSLYGLCIASVSSAGVGDGSGLPTAWCQQLPRCAVKLEEYTARLGLTTPRWVLSDWEGTQMLHVQLSQGVLTFVGGADLNVSALIPAIPDFIKALHPVMTTIAAVDEEKSM